MSRAFIRETDADARPEPLPDLAIPPPPNLVTTRGLGLIEAAIAEIEACLGDPGALDHAALARLRRRLRYWTARRASARLVGPLDDPDEVGFGSRVTVEWPGRGRVTMEIVGEDESNPAEGRVSWRAPTPTALMGNGVGDTVVTRIGGNDVTLAIMAVDNARSGD